MLENGCRFVPLELRCEAGGSAGSQTRSDCCNISCGGLFGGRSTRLPVNPHVTCVSGGADEDRTHDLRIANATLSQLSYRPISRDCIDWRAFLQVLPARG